MVLIKLQFLKLSRQEARTHSPGEPCFPITSQAISAATDTHRLTLRTSKITRHRAVTKILSKCYGTAYGRPPPTCLMSQPTPSPGGLEGHARHTPKDFLKARALTAMERTPYPKGVLNPCTYTNTSSLGCEAKRDMACKIQATLGHGTDRGDDRGDGYTVMENRRIAESHWVKFSKGSRPFIAARLRAPRYPRARHRHFLE